MKNIETIVIIDDFGNSKVVRTENLQDDESIRVECVDGVWESSFYISELVGCYGKNGDEE